MIFLYAWAAWCFGVTIAVFILALQVAWDELVAWMLRKYRPRTQDAVYPDAAELRAVNQENREIDALEYLWQQSGGKS